MRMPTAEEAEQIKEQDTYAAVLRMFPKLDWHALWEQEDEEEWLVYPLVARRRLTALFAAAGAGKSLLMLEIAAGLASGREVLGQKTEPVRVLYIDFENDPRGDVRTRLQGMEYKPADLDNLSYLSFPSMGYLDTERGALELLAAVTAYRSELVVIDTISRAVGGEENDNDTWLNFYKHTGLALKQAQVALIRLDHTGKDETKGARGGSAKSGDVDAAWKLTEVTKDERYRLDCTKARFPLETKELALIRHEFPLRHTLESSSKGDEREARIVDLIGLADRDGLPVATGGRKFREWLTSRGVRARKDVMEEAIRRRKNRSDLLFDPSPTSPKGVGGRTPNESPPIVSPQSPPNEGVKINNERKNVPQINGGTPGGHTPVSMSPPLSLSIREGDGTSGGTQGTNGHLKLDPDQPCKRCKRALGILVVQRGLDAHVACQREIDREEAIKARGE